MDRKKLFIISSVSLGFLVILFIGFYFVQQNNSMYLNESMYGEDFKQIVDNENYSSTYRGMLEFVSNNPYQGPEIKIDLNSTEEIARRTNSMEDLKILDEIEKDLFSGYFGYDLQLENNTNKKSYLKIRPVAIDYIYENQSGKKMYYIKTYDYYRVTEPEVESSNGNTIKMYKEGDTRNYPFSRSLVVKDSPNSKFRYLSDVNERLYCDLVTAEGFEAKSGENCVTVEDLERDYLIDMNYRENGYDRYTNEYYKSIEVK